MNTTQLNTPVLFLLYNRPDFALKVFQQIRRVKPKKLYICVDGAKDLNDDLNVEECRNVEFMVDWPCEIHRLYRSENLGCKDSVSNGISWFFKFESKGIILEDDCLPNDSFFHYCEELLNYYENDTSIGHISGANFLHKNNNEESYYFSNYSYSWGWATWRRAWQLYDKELKELPSTLNNNLYTKLNLSFKEKAYWNSRLIKTYLNKIDTWDYQWLYTLWTNNLKSIVPTKNLISNIGFDTRSTHTAIINPNVSHLKTTEIPFIVHTNSKKVNSKNDSQSFNNAVELSVIESILYYLKWKLFMYFIKWNNTQTHNKPDLSWAYLFF